ncbi:MAG TPA: hypothetical protein VH333_17965 [Pseudonocardiaceae bacterium]|nr:hypothetical protein [Pseudonocardiaceae bacterium]
MGDAADSADSTTSSPATTTDAGLTAAIAGIVSALDDVCSHIDAAIARTKSWNDQSHQQHSHSGGSGGDRYVSGGTNWDGYDLPTLVSMVADPASPSQVQSVAGLWRTNGSAITQGAENLSQSLTSLMNYWQGSAADQVSGSVDNTANWISAVGETAGKVADQIEDAGGALQSAQNTMPGVPTSNFWLAYNTAADGATTGAAAGPFGIAAGTMVGGLTSVFGASTDQSTMKQQAVQTMQRYEQAGVSIDTETPTFTPPPTWGVGSDDTRGALGPSIAVTVPGATTPTTSTGADLTTTPSFADSPTGRWDALTGGSQLGGAGGAGGAAHGGFGGGGVGLIGGGLGSRNGSDVSRPNTNASPGAVAAAQNEPAGVAARAGGGMDGASVLEDVDGRAGMAGPMGMGAPMGGMGGSRGGSDGEHRRRIPFEEDPFVTGLKAVPPVIGLNAVDREADK